MNKIVFFCIPAHGHTNPTMKYITILLKNLGKKLKMQVQSL